MMEKEMPRKERSLTKMLLGKEAKVVENEAVTNVEKKAILPENALCGKIEWTTAAQQL